MATRMRQRRGTATQWTNSNPVLGAGEIGWESDTNKFKIGDGINHWADLDYFVDESSISTSLGDYVETSTLGQNDGVATLDSSGKLESSQVPTNLATTTALDLKQDKVSGVSDTEIGYLDGVTSAIQTQIDSKAPTSNPTFTGTVTTEDLVINGDVTVNSGEFLASATSILIEDNLIQIAHENAANTVDLGLVVGYTESSTAKHAGIVRDVSSDKWKLFKGVTTEPSTTVDFTQGTLDDLEVAGLVASSATIGDVSNTELQYLNGVTSSIQTQIDAKLDSTTASSTYLTQSSASSVYAPLASPTFTGTVTLPSGTVTSTMIADGTIVDADINASAAIAKTKIAGTAITAADTGTVTNAMLAGSIANNKLANSSITLNGSVVSLGGSATISPSGGAFLPAAYPFKPSNVTLRATYTSSTSGLSFPVDQVWVVAVGGGGSGGSSSSGTPGGGGGGGGACIVGWIPAPTSVTIGGSNGNTTVVTPNGTLIASAGGAGGSGQASPPGHGIMGSGGGGAMAPQTTTSYPTTSPGGSGSAMGISSGGAGGIGTVSGNTSASGGPGGIGSSGGGGGTCNGGYYNGSGGAGRFGPGGGGGGGTYGGAGGAAYNIATGNSYTGGNGSSAAGGGAGVLGNGGNASGVSAGGGGAGGGGGGGAFSGGYGGAGGGSGVVYIYY